MHIYKIWFFLILSLFVISCSSTDNIPTSNQSAKLLYENAIQEANNKNYENANNTFQSILEEFPYSIWATKSKVMMAWVYYEENKYDNSITIAESFIKNHPENELVPYALYLIAMSYYERIFDVERDTRMTVLAKEAFEKLIYLYPNSEFSRDSKLKVELARSNLAGKQMAIGRFYQKQKHFAAAIRRFQRVIDEFAKAEKAGIASIQIDGYFVDYPIVEKAQRTVDIANLLETLNLN